MGELDQDQIFDVVIEKGGVSDIYAAKPGEQLYLQQFLHCTVERAFGRRGGTIITMGFMPPPGYIGLPGLLAKRPDLHCVLEKLVPVGRKFAHHGGRLMIFVIQCSALSETSMLAQY